MITTLWMIMVLCSCLSCATNFDEFLSTDPRLKSTNCKSTILSRIRRHIEESQLIQTPQRVPRIGPLSSQQSDDSQRLQPPPNLFPSRQRQTIQGRENFQRQSQRLKDLEQVSNDERQQVVQDETRQRKYNITGEAARRPHGGSYRFCDLFGCDCVPPPNSKCCKGYKFDPRGQKCREVL
ncbi:hypothetical protein TNCT_205531 [Trichonephila clavata]|uniref:Uncharacterized protein n=1 Tax=Trichonephila clavata TaxID=2740835 RepID=A0A8X6HL61_TRICU|nr:hypothetical protein TNCT_205531 [Trichonephila clavata]